MTILRSSPIPLYHQLETLLREKLGAGNYRPGELLPTDDDLCRQYGVSKITVRQAMQKLKADGLVVRARGRGTFATERAVRPANLKMTCFLEDLIALGIPAEVRVLRSGSLAVAGAVARALDVPAGTEVFSFQKLLAVSGQPFALSTEFVLRHLGARLTRPDLRAGHLLRKLEDRCGVHLGEAEQIIESSMADPDIAARLRTTVGAPILVVTRTTCSTAGCPVEHGISIYRGDRARFVVTQKRRASARGEWALERRGVRRSPGYEAARRAGPRKRVGE